MSPSAALEADKHLCGEVIPALRPRRNKNLCGAQRARGRREREGGGDGERAGRGEGGGGSRFIARSREASTEHSFNQTVTSPPGAARRLENRSLLGSLPRLRFCSHAPRLSSERCAGSDGTFFFFFF